ncbi:hypothetical protein [Bacteroides sp. 224]|uniref:hypothetical protein n=1 Tax=Bacteroides sp. 224 TaxID=2302936 RepID=UPI0013D3B5CC|nr:hypothetical protein [Bacteroides sp. 224]NDV66859.1 hypothetical protein [Bacteroides sp. 224]
MSVQEIIVALIVFLCVAEVIRRTLKFFRSPKNNENPCANCVGGCDLKRIMDEKKQNCGAIQKKNDEKCCG